jgi:malate dehydrogenase
VKVIAAADVDQAKGDIVVGPKDVVTPLARDRAKELNVRILVSGSPAAPAKAAAPGPAVAPAPPRPPRPGASPAPAPAERPLPASGVLYRRGAPLPGAARGEAGTGATGARPTVAVVGAGHVGGTTALRLADSDLFSRITLVDPVPGLAEGLALDLWHGAALRGFTTRTAGSTEMAEIAGADFVVVTAGRARQPGMSRTDLTGANAEIIRSVAAAVRTHAPAAVVVVVTNPLEEMTHLLATLGGLPERRVVGMAGVLDAARFRALVGLTGVAEPDEITAYALGSHGSEMVIPLSQASARGVLLEQLLDAKTLAAIVERTRDSGAEVVALLKTGSAYLSPAAATASMVKAMAEDTGAVVSACVRSDGAYGLVNTRVGLPVRLTRQGAGEIVRLDLRPAELRALREAAERIAARIRELG